MDPDLFYSYMPTLCELTSVTECHRAFLHLGLRLLRQHFAGVDSIELIDAWLARAAFVYDRAVMKLRAAVAYASLVPRPADCTLSVLSTPVWVCSRLSSRALVSL